MQRKLSLIFILYFIEIINAQFGNCDYEQVIQKPVPIFNPKYPKPYTNGTVCRWIAKSNDPIEIKCDLRMPLSNQCLLDYLLIQSSASDPGIRYCGHQNLTIVSRKNPLIASLYTTRNSPGGTFFCTLKIVKTTTPNCKCGWKNPSRIVGGEETGINEYPMMAAIVDVEKKEIHCGATIINSKQVLTAAHCVFEKKINLLGVLIGEHDFTKSSDSNATKLLKVLKYVIHSQYNFTDNDIALVTTQQIIEFGAQVGPVCLPFQHSRTLFQRDLAKLLGWGSNEFAGAKSEVLQKAFVHIISNSACQQSYPTVYVGPRQICHYQEGKDACQFDSGGPLLWLNPKTERILLIGIISYGSTCADNYPGVNTRVGAFIDWIIQQTVPGYEYCRAE